MPPAPQPCHFEGDGAPGAPRVWALQLPAAAPDERPETSRQRARDQVRLALRALVARHYQLPAHAIQLSDQRGTRVHATLVTSAPLPAGWHTLGLSISHAPLGGPAGSVALIALRPAGLVGVDLAALPPGWAAGDDHALRRQAALYLGPAHPAAAAADDPAQPADHRATRFVQGWAELEARLKCLGQPLAEWSPALVQRLARCRSAAVQWPAAVRQLLPAASAAAVAWAE